MLANFGNILAKSQCQRILVVNYLLKSSIKDVSQDRKFSCEYLLESFSNYNAFVTYK